jgi:hypothetical protein
MSLVAEHGARERGNTICNVLSLRGLRPLWFKTEAMGDRIVVCFEIMPRWRKALILAATDDPNSAETALSAWKGELLAELNAGEPREITQIAIAHFGELAVRAALAPTTVH